MTKRRISIASICLLLSLIAALPIAAQPTALPEEPSAPPTAPASGTAPGNEPAASEPIPAPAPANASNDKPGHEYFVKAAAALKKAQAVTFDLKYTATGGMEQYSATLDARVKMLRDGLATGQTNGWMIRSTGQGTPKPGAERMTFDVAWIGTSVEFANHPERKVIEKRSSREAKSQAFSIGNSARVTEFFAARPFNRELLPSTDYKILEAVTVGGVEVIPIEVTYGEKRGKSVWYFANEDGLPRKFVSVIDNAMMSGTTLLELSNLTIEQARPTKLTKADVRVAVPDGYSEDRPPKPAQPAVAQATPEGKTLPATVKNPEELASPLLAPGTGAEGGKPPSVIVTEIPPPALEKLIEQPSQSRSFPRAAPLFDLRASTGGNIALESLRGNYIVIEFGGSWCLPCRESRPELDLLAAEFKDKPVRLLALSVRDKAADVAIERFRSQNHAYPLLAEADATAIEFRVHAYPSYYVLDESLTIIDVLPGYTKDVTIPAIRALLQHRMGLPPSPTMPGTPEAQPK